MKEALTIPLKHEMEMSIKFLESLIIHENKSSTDSQFHTAIYYLNFYQYRIFLINLLLIVLL